VTVKEGEPEAWIFDVPATYIERPPSAAMAEAARRFPGVKGIACQSCDQSKKDEAYYHAQKHNSQK
jgi:hypothetical protein